MVQRTLRLRIYGMNCPGCADYLASSLQRRKGVLRVNVDWKAGSAEVRFDPDAITEKAVLRSRILQWRFPAERAEA